MPTRPLGPDTITIRVPVITVDTRDNTSYYDYVDGATIAHCSFQPFLMTEKFQEEFTVERQTTRTFYRVFVPVLPETLEITETYRIIFDGVEYQVHAVPGSWRHFSGKRNHIAFLVNLRIG